MNDRELIELADKLTFGELSKLINFWMMIKGDRLKHGEAEEFANHITKVMARGFINRIDDLRDHAMTAEMAAVNLAAKKRNIKEAKFHLAKLKGKSFLNWNWFLKGE